jgi:hypothetical protein
MSERVKKALNCNTFVSSNLERYVGVEGLESQGLGLEITLRCAIVKTNAKTRYSLAAIPLAVLDKIWENPIDISQFILNVLQTKDSMEWYVPSKQELLADAGLEA